MDDPTVKSRYGKRRLERDRICQELGQELITAEQTVKIRVFPYQDRVTELLREHCWPAPLPYNGRILLGGMATYKAACFELRTTVKDAPMKFWDKMEADFRTGNPAEVQYVRNPSNLHREKTDAEMMPSPTFCLPMKGEANRATCSVVFLSWWRVLFSAFAGYLSREPHLEDLLEGLAKDRE